MALELLAGPFDLNVGGTPVSSWGGFNQQAWIQGLGLLSLEVIADHTGVYVAQLDGAASYRSPYAAVSTVLLPDIRSADGLMVFDGLHYRNFGYLNGSPDFTPFLTLGSLTPAAHLVCVDRFVKFSGNQVLSSPLTDGVTYTLEYTFDGTAPSGTVSVSRTNVSGIVCVAWGASPGQIRFFDTFGRVQVGPVQYVGEAFSGCWYIPKWDIFLEFQIVAKQLKVFANAVAPATLSNPSALSTVTAGNVSTMKVQLLGAQGEPCVGELIDWSVTSGDGAISPLQSATDVDGYATANYAAPVGSSGSVTINAAVNF